jgi:hypothetical protein
MRLMLHTLASARTTARSTLRRLCVVPALASVAASGLSMPDASRVRGALIGGLVGDALALGGHYEYDAKVIAEKARAEALRKESPETNSDHTRSGVTQTSLRRR